MNFRFETAMRVVHALGTVFVLSSCNPELSNVPPNFPAERLSKTSGVIFFSTTQQGFDVPLPLTGRIMTAAGSKLWEHVVVGTKFLEAREDDFMSTNQIDEDDPVGAIHMVELPEGDYSLEDFTGADSSTFMYWTTKRKWSAPELRLNFHVTRGAVTYAGNVDFHYDGQGKIQTRLKNAYARDSALVAQMFPKIDIQSIRTEMFRPVVTQRSD